jgi:hypothetical protein
MGSPSYEFTGQEVGKILAREASKILDLDLPLPLRIEMSTTSNVVDGVTFVRVTLHTADKEVSNMTVEDDDIPDTPEQRALIAKHNADIKIKHPNLVEISTSKVRHPTPPLTAGYRPEGSIQPIASAPKSPPPPKPTR